MDTSREAAAPSEGALVVVDQLAVPIDEGEPEPRGPELSVLATVTTAVANDDLLVQQATSTIQTASVRLLNVEENAVALRAQMEAVRKWLVSAMASAAPEHQQKYADLLDQLDKLEVQDVQRVEDMSLVANVCGRTMDTMCKMLRRLDKLYDLKAIASRSLHSSHEGAVNFDLWQAHLIDEELQLVEKLGVEIAERRRDVHQVNMEACIATIQQVERQLVSYDHKVESKHQLNLISEYQRQKVDLRKDRTRDEAAGEVIRAEISTLKAKIQAQTEFVAQLQDRSLMLQQDIKKLDKSLEMTAEEAAREVSRLKKEAAEQREQLLKAKNESTRQARDAFEELEADYDKKVRELDQELFDAEVLNGNHIVFCIDKSGSMWGSRWTNALQALDCFRGARVAQGSLDKVSVVVFDHQAMTVLSGEPINSSFVDTVRTKVSPSGGTCYGSAWEELARCVEKGPTHWRALIIFLTDGQGSRMQDAIARATQLHKQHTNMQTVVINVDSAVPQSVLEPLVKAANGGCTHMDVCGQHASLLMNVNATDMVPHFRRLASMASLRAASLQQRIGLVREREEAERRRQAHRFEQMQAELEGRLASLDASYQRLQGAGEEDARQVKATLVFQKEELSKESESKRSAIKEETEKLGRLEKELAEKEAELAGHVKTLEENKATFERTMAQLNQMHEKCATDLQTVTTIQADQRDKAGTSHTHTIDQYRKELVELRRLVTVNRINATAHALQVAGMHDLIALFTKRLRKPLGSTPISHSAIAEFVFPRLLQERMLPNLSLVQSVKLLLEYEAACLGAEGAEVKKVVEPIVQSGVSPEELCAACGLQSKSKESEDAQAKVVKKVEDDLLEARGFGKKGKLKRQIAVLEQERDAHKEAYEKLKEAYDNANEEAREKMESKLERKADELQSAQEKLADKEQSFAEGKQDLLEQYLLTWRLIRVVMQYCAQSYVQSLARKEMEVVMGELESYSENVHKPMKDLLHTVSRLKQAYGIKDISSSPRSGGAAAVSGGYPQRAPLRAPDAAS